MKCPSCASANLTTGSCTTCLGDLVLCHECDDFTIDECTCPSPTAKPDRLFDPEQREHTAEIIRRLLG